MDVFFWILGAVFLDSLIGLAGAFTFFLKEEQLKGIIFLLVAFSTGALLGGAFFHLLPESLEKLPVEPALMTVLAGFLVFLVLEIYLHWHHCVECDIHPFTYLMIIGDGVHNFIDGVVIAVSFFVSIPIGIITTIMIIGHEIPQELGVFGVLLHGGQTKQKALLYSFLAQATCIIGGIAGYLLSTQAQAASSLLIPFAAGGFIYIAASDLIPELHKSGGFKRFSGLSLFLIGMAFMLGIKLLSGE